MREIIEKCYCDRCKKLISEDDDCMNMNLKWASLKGDGHNYDLCKECTRKLQTWLEVYVKDNGDKIEKASEEN